MIAAPLQLTQFSFAPIFSLGAQRKKRLCPGLAPRPNILAVTASELLWLSYVLCDLGLRFSLPSLIYCDNISVTLDSIGLFTRSSMPERKMSNLD